ncbi:VOC family protein [Streptomyces sp. NPDC020742]|uniref:VOC family protein n=1 Tax=unclassified Streptomyces TaxID=2593676 RepID=UPI0033F038B0
MRVKDFDHLVLAVRDIERSLAFYCGPLGLEPVRVAEWRAGTAPFPSVRISPATIIDLISRPEDAPDGSDTADGSEGPEGSKAVSNVDHICLVVDPLDWQEVIDSGTFTVLDGPGTRYGARGEAQSIYVQDPDGNTVELRWYPQDATE